MGEIREESIRGQKRSSKSERHGLVKYPLLENALYSKFLEMREMGKTVKRWWFNSKTKNLLKEIYPDQVDNFKMFNRWFTGFCRRNRISLRRKTHTAQKSPEDLRHVIEEFHASVLRERKRGVYSLKDLANMDQTPLMSVMDDTWTSDHSGTKEVWVSDSLNRGLVYSLRTWCTLLFTTVNPRYLDLSLSRPPAMSTRLSRRGPFKTPMYFHIKWSPLITTSLNSPPPPPPVMSTYSSWNSWNRKENLDIPNHKIPKLDVQTKKEEREIFKFGHSIH